MKYSKTNKPLQCYMRQSTWYREAVKDGKVVGICWHDTGANNKYIKRYVQPDDNASDKATLLKKIGVNNNHNDWNHVAREAGVNAFIGTLADDSVAAVEVGPNTLHAWGVGGGFRGSLNGYITKGGKATWCKDFWLQFEICADDYSNKDYFNKCYKEAVEYTAYICKLYNLNPKGTVTFNGVKVPVITCHKDSYTLGLGSGHGDVMTWFNKYGKTMDDVRNDVYKLLQNDPKEEEKEVFKKGDKSLGVYSSKVVLSVAKALGMINTGESLQNNNEFNDDMVKSTKLMQKLAGLTQNGEVDQNTMNHAMKLVKDKIAENKTTLTKAQSDLKTAKTNLTNTKKTLTTTESKLKAANTDLVETKKQLTEATNKLNSYESTIKKLEEELDRLEASVGKPGDVNNDGFINNKDLLTLRKMLLENKQ